MAEVPNGNQRSFICRPLRGLAFRAPVIHGLTGLLKKAFYVSPSGYSLVSWRSGTQGCAFPLDEVACANELGAKLTLGWYYVAPSGQVSER